MLEKFTCIICPNGCDLEVAFEAAEEENSGKQISARILSVRGAKCKRGEEYAGQEIVSPRRTMASSVKVENGILPLASVRLTEPIPRDMIFPVMAEIKKLKVTAPVYDGDVLVRNILGLKSDLIVTKDIESAQE